MLGGQWRTVRLRGAAAHDALLLAGLAVALLTMFDRTIALVLRFAAEVEQSYGVRLVPALVVLTGIFVIHLHTKRQELKTERAAIALQATLALERTRELERLSAFGEVLAAALTPDAIRVAVCRFVPDLAGERDICVAVRAQTGWETLVDTAPPELPLGPLPATTLEVGVAEGEPVRADGLYRCPLVAASTTVGVLIVSERHQPLTPTTERVLTAIASLLAIAIRNVQLFATLHETALTDALTGCYNRVHLMAVLDAELRRARRTRADLAVIVFDLDAFKALNDAHGHLAGDAALASVGQRLQAVLRRSDVRCRIGGDEFAVILPDTYPAGAAQVAETLRREIAQLAGVDGKLLGLTSSIGVASAVTADSPESLLHRADLAQYRAKRAGGNQVMPAVPEGRVESSILPDALATHQQELGHDA